MNASSRPIRIMLLESDPSLSGPIGDILQARSALRLFHLIQTSTLADAFREIDKETPDLLLIDVDPLDDPEFTALKRLHQTVPHIPAVAILSDQHQTRALEALQNGAQSYLLASQINNETLPAFLLRSIERHAAHKAVLESEERFRLMIENASDVILVLDKAGVISYAGPSTQRILNHRPADLVARNALDFIHRDDRNSFLHQFDKAFENGDSLPSVQFRFKRTEGYIHMEGKGRIAPDPTGRPVCILNSHDVSHRVKLEEELRALSLRDELTGLHNRRSFVTCLDQQLKLAQRSKLESIFLLFIDLDGFKAINDNLGHKVGDRALIEAANILKQTFRDADLVARLGGDEFVIFLTNDVEALKVEGLKQRLIEAVDFWNGQEERAYRLAMSVGVLHHDLHEKSTTEELLRRADELMYLQKREKKRQAGLLPPALPSPEESLKN